MSKEFWIHIDMNNYRTGINIYSYDKPPSAEDEASDTEDDCAPVEATAYTFELPEQCRIYIVAEFPEYKVKGYIDTKDRQECTKWYYKMFSQLYNCLPFKVTDYNCAYKEEGYYPEVPEDIHSMPGLKIIEDIQEENTAGDNLYFVFALDSHGNNFLTEML